MAIDIRDNVNIESFYQGFSEPEGCDVEVESDKFDFKKISNIEFDDVDMKDRPDFADAYISYAEYDGAPMTDDQLAELNEKHGDFVHDKLIEYLY